MDLNSILQESVCFGFFLSILTFWAGAKLQAKFRYVWLNPLLFSMVVIIVFLVAFHIDYETYDYGARYITFFLSPATVCLAVPLYKQVQVLKKNWAALIAGVLCGCLAHAVIIIGLGFVFSIDTVLSASMLPKSVTTAIALGVSQEAGGIQAVTVIGVCVAGLFGAVCGPALLQILKIREPIAQGLAIGTASHAMGTSRTFAMGEVQAAMSSLAIVVAGLLTVVIVPLVSGFLVW